VKKIALVLFMIQTVDLSCEKNIFSKIKENTN